MSINEFLEKLPKSFITFFGLFLVLAIGGLDTITSYDLSFTLLYLFPIMLVAWYAGALPATLISIISAVIWAMSDITSGHIYSNFFIPVWNALLVLGIFLIVTNSIAALKRLSIKERLHACADDLTGLTNIGFFYEQARVEISRAAISKRSLTLAYINIDNLRLINEKIGHITGYKLLQEVALMMRCTLRPTDLISILGDTGFVILMPGTKNENATGIIIKVRDHFLDMVKNNGWPVTFSAGVVTCEDATCTIDGLIKLAEDLVNAAKETGKNEVKYKIVDSSSTTTQCDYLGVSDESIRVAIDIDS